MRSQSTHPQKQRDSSAPVDIALGRGNWFALGIPLALTLLAYLPSLRNGFVYDDAVEVTANRFIGDWSFIWKSFVNDSWWFRDPLRLPQSSYYRPLQDVWFALNYHLFGLKPLGWHVTSIVVQLVAVYFVFRIARELTRDRIAAAFAASLYGLMPIHAQAVSWASAIPLGGWFALGALMCFIRRRRAPRRLLALSLGLFAAGLLSHESPVVLPVIIAAYVYLLEPAPEGDAAPTSGRVWMAVRESAPFFAVDAAYLVLRLRVLGFIARSNVTNHMTRAERIFSIPAVVANYLALLVVPWRAGPAHPLVMADRWSQPAFYLPLAGVALIVMMLWLLFAHHPHRRLYAFCAAWAVVAIAPVLNLGSLGPVEMIQDRYLYLASAAWCIFLGDIAAMFVAAGGALAPVAAGAFAIFAIVSGASLWRIEPDWHDDITYFNKCIEMFPGSWLCHNDLGLALAQSGDLDGAEREIEASLPLRPDDGEGLYNLGSLHIRMGKPGRAEQELRRALAQIKIPSAENYIQLAEAADLNGDQVAVDQALQLAAATLDGPVPAALEQAKLRIRHDDYAGAEAALQPLLSKHRDVTDVWLYLALAVGAQGRYDEALSYLDTALRIDSKQASLHVARATVLAELGRNDQALAECRRALALEPGNAEATALIADLHDPQPSK